MWLLFFVVVALALLVAALTKTKFTTKKIAIIGVMAALCIAALAAEGRSEITGLHHIDRGYEDLARDLRLLGADAVRTENGENQHESG